MTRDYIMPVRGVTVTVVPVVTAGAYSAKDAVGQLLSFANAVGRPGGTSKITSLTLTDLTVTANVLNLWLFNASPASPVADNGAFDIADGELPTVVGVIPIAAANYYVATDNQAAMIFNVGLEFTLPAGATTLYGQLCCTGTPTYVSTADLTLKLGFEYLD